MATPLKLTAIAFAAFALVGCEYSNQEAGAQLDNGHFGNATMQNMMAQMCRGRAKGHIVPDAVVVLDPNSTAATPKYVRASVRCSGHLNGRYAQVIFNNYILSASPDVR